MFDNGALPLVQVASFWYRCLVSDLVAIFLIKVYSFWSRCLYLWPVAPFFREGHVHNVFDGQAGHGALSQRDDLVDALHHGVQLGVSFK